MNSELLDRNNEIEEVIDIINKPNNLNKIILLTGISGVGKSGLVEKLSQSNMLLNTIVFVKISKSSINTIENQQYFNCLYKVIAKYAKEKMFDKIPSPNQQGIKSVRNLFRVLKSIIKSKLGISDMSPLSEPEDDASVIRKKDYLLYILKKTNVIIDIENIQNIDTQSLEILKEIISESTKKTFVFEYTLTNKNSEHFKNFYKELSELNCEITTYKVEKMDFEIAKTLAPPNISIDEKELHALYETSQGNLMEIILANKDTSKEMSNIQRNLNRLSKNKKYIIFLLFLNNSPLSYEELARLIIVESREEIIRDFNELEDLIKELISAKMIVIENDMLKIKHDSIIDVLEHSVGTPILYCAYSTLKNYYTNRLENLPIAVEKLLGLYLKFSDQELLSFLPMVKKYLLGIKYPKLIIKKLSYFREELLNVSSYGFQGVYFLTLMLVEVCISQKMAEEAKKNLQLIYDESNAYHIALNAQILSLHESQEALEKLYVLTNSTTESSRLRLICEICLLYLKTKLLNTSQTKKHGKKLVENALYKKYTEYAFLLRNYAELCDDTEECTNLYLKALKIFEKKRMFHDMSSVYISLSMLNAYNGNLRKAYKYIDDAMKLDKSEISLCYVLNNKSVLEILEGTYNDTTRKNLKNALLLSVSKYEKLIIYSNLLIYYCLNKNLKDAQSIAKFIEESDYQRFKYEELQHIILQDLYYFYSVFNHNDSKKNKFYRQILQLINSPDIRKSTKEIASGMNHLIDSSEFYAQFPYRVDFLGYWEFTIDNDLSHSE